MNDQKILSICIPTYNRAEHLKRLLIILEKQWLEKWGDLLEIIVSDNCSTDNTKGVVDNIRSKMFPVKYIRNERNIGMDRNFVTCLKLARGKYVWLLGDDDYLHERAIQTILEILEESEIGLLHLSMKTKLYSRKRPIKLYQRSDSMIFDVSYWITFISANIVNAKYISQIDFDKYIGTYFCAVPLYFHALFSENINIIVFQPMMDAGKDLQRNGGYNVFEVFIKNYFAICRSFKHAGYSNRMLKKEKFIFFKNFLSGLIVNVLIFKKTNNFIIQNSWKFILKEYMTAWYFLPVLMVTLLKSTVAEVISFAKEMY